MKPDINQELKDIVESLKVYSELERLSGIEFSVRSNADAGSGLPTCGGASKERELALLKAEIAESGCCQLCRTRAKVVFGSGDPDAELMFVGEAPGRDEDLQGLPFVGRAGQLLTKIIESIGLKRSDVYICNILKCRPPNNRAPSPAEILACEPYLKRQIGIISPRIICALGKFAAQTLLKSQTPISSLRGKFYNYENIKLIPTFHPAYLLRNPGDKRLVWEDMKKIKKVLDVK